MGWFKRIVEKFEKHDENLECYVRNELFHFLENRGIRGFIVIVDVVRTYDGIKTEIRVIRYYPSYFVCFEQYYTMSSLTNMIALSRTYLKQFHNIKNYKKF